MGSAAEIQAAISKIHDQESFIQRLLIESLDWDIDPDISQIEDTAYEYTAEELNSPLLDEKCDGRALRIAFQQDVPWGLFLIEFTHEAPFVQSRGLTMPLRQLLNALVLKQRRDSELPAWKQENLLFICTHNYRHFRFGYFQAAPGKEKTAPLRLFGWNEGDTAVRTLCEHNLPHLRWNDIENWAEAFSIEKVTRDFYRDYATVFRRVEDAIAEHNNISGDALRMFTQMLFNRLMFLRFIERKGWLTFGDTPDYLANLYAAGGLSGESFYASRLMPLFFEGLAVEGQQKFEIIGRVPFLNGGLFERTDLDTQITDIPDEAFAHILASPNQNGVGGLFYRYNFTISESTPLDIEVAVDPEMLGKVFEELVTGRRETGSYYTPRPVVAFMCREAIKGYLSHKTSASPETVEMLIDHHEIASDMTEGHANEILWYLDTIKACDPACGSGAYLLGLMQELIAARRSLQSKELRADPKFLYNLKLGIIGRNLYGVDNDLFATNIAKLRLWLSLSVEADQPQPLPNLDFKIETGDSLLGPCRELLGPLFNNELSERAREIQELKYRHEMAHGQEKQQLTAQLEEKIEYLKSLAGEARQDDAIVWPADFPEVFCPRDKFEATLTGEFGFMADAQGQKTFKVARLEPGGFDVVLANPPYVRHELIKSIKPRLQAIFGDRIYSGTADLYTYFYARAVEMLAPGGVLSFISSNKFFRASYGSKLRRFLAEETSVLSITDFRDSPVFESAVAYPMIFIAQKGTARGETWYTETRVSGHNLDVRAVISAKGRSLPKEAITGANWNFTDKRTASVLSRMIEVGTPLREYVSSRVYRGITTGCNKAFTLDARAREELIREDPRAAELIKPLLLGKDISRWTLNHDNRWMIVTPIGVDIQAFPSVLRHLRGWQDELEKRYDQGDYWWELRACTYYDRFQDVKIVSTKVSREPTFAIDTHGSYLGNTAYFIPIQGSESLYVLGILNSYYSLVYAKERFVGKQNDWYEVQPPALEEFPIPPASDKDKAKIGACVRKCIEAQGKNCKEWEDQIDSLVASLYGLEA